MCLVLRWKEVQAQFLVTSRWLGASGLLERRFKAEKLASRGRLFAFRLPPGNSIEGHLTTNDTSKSLTSPSHHLSPSSCLHRAFPLGSSLFLCVGWLLPTHAVCRLVVTFALQLMTLRGLIDSLCTPLHRAILHPLHWIGSAYPVSRRVRLSQSMSCLTPSMSSSRLRVQQPPHLLHDAMQRTASRRLRRKSPGKG
jgi:hypothetical protein